MNSSDLENKLIAFSVLILAIVVKLSGTKAGSHVGGQLVRSGTSVSLHYGEARSAESKKDLIHKLSVVLKELRETQICLKLIYMAKLHENETKIQIAIKENDELISILVKSIATAKKPKFSDH